MTWSRSTATGSTARAVEPARGRAARRPRLPAIPPLRRPLRQSDQPGRDLARARRQCLEPGAADARRRAADRSVRRLDQPGRPTTRAGSAGSGWCAAAAAAPTAPARSPARSSWKARRPTRPPDSPPASLMAAATASTPLPATARRLGGGFVTLSGALMRAATASFRSSRDQRGPADRASPYRQASLAARGVAPLVAGDRAAGECLGLHRRARARHRVQRDRDRGADASLRLVGRGRLPFSALAYVQVRDFSNRFAAVGAGRAAATPDARSIFGARRPGSARALEIRPVAGPVELRLGADWRETEGRTQELFQFVAGAPTRGRVAGGRTRTARRLRRGRLEQGAADPDRRRPARSLVDRGRPPARAHARHRRAADRRRLPRSERLGADRARGRRLAGRGAGHAARRRLSRLAAADPQRALPPVPRRRRRHRRQCRALARAAARASRRASNSGPAPRRRIGVTLFANRLDDAIANVTLGQGPGIFPGVGFVAAGGQFRKRQNVEAVTSRGVELDASVDARPAAASPPATASPTPRSGAAARRCRSTACAPPRRRGTASPRAWPGRARAAPTPRSARAMSRANMRTTSTPSASPMRSPSTPSPTLPLAAGLAIEARGENLTDERVVAGISGAGIVERATPRTLWLGLRWRQLDSPPSSARRRRRCRRRRSARLRALPTSPSRCRPSAR